MFQSLYLKFQRVAIWASGSDYQLLEKTPSFVRNRYSIIGVINLGLSTLATMAVGFGLMSGFNSVIGGIVFGLVWGALVFSITRIVYQFKFLGSTYKSLLQALMRILIVILIQTPTTVPLMLKLFETDIETYAKLTTVDRVRIIESQLQDHYIWTQQRIDSLNSRVRKGRNRVNELEELFYNEINGSEALTSSGSTSGMTGYGPRARSLDMARERAQKQLDSLESKTKEEIKFLESTREKQRMLSDSTSAIIAEPTGILTNYNYLDELAQNNSLISGIRFFITLFFMLVSSFPVFLRLFSRDNIEKVIKEREKIEIERSFQRPTENFGIQAKNINVLNNSRDGDEKSDFQFFFESLGREFKEQQTSVNEQSSKMLNNGLLVTLFGVFIYLIWIVISTSFILTDGNFHWNRIYIMVASTIMFGLIQFLGGWYLKQYRHLRDLGIVLRSNERRFDRYYLAYLSIQELGGTVESKASKVEHLIALLGTDASASSGTAKDGGNESPISEAINSISNLVDVLKKKSNT